MGIMGWGGTIAASRKEPPCAVHLHAVWCGGAFLLPPRIHTFLLLNVFSSPRRHAEERERELKLTLNPSPTVINGLPSVRLANTPHQHLPGRETQRPEAWGEEELIRRDLHGEMGLEIIEETPALPLLALNHVSFLVESVSRSVKFYEEVLGFVSVKRPSSFSFEGAWLFNYGVGIHLLQCTSPEQVPRKKAAINPKDNHISFQCSDIRLVMRKLEEMGIDYVTAVVEEAGITVDQLFFHDPDCYMVEICNCHVLPVLPLSKSCPLRRPLFPGGLPASPDVMIAADGVLSFSLYGGKQFASLRCAVEVEEKMMECLVTDIMKISF